MSVPIESVEARLERQELPVKYEFCRLQNARITYVEALRQASAKNDGGGGTGNDQAPPEMSKKKSRNAQKRQRAQARHQDGPNICVGHAQNTCTRGSSCKYSHDLHAYLQSKPPDYPGDCPFTAAEKCPYGLMCRWAESHKILHPVMQEYLEKKKMRMDAERGEVKMENGEGGNEEKWQQNGVENGRVNKEELIEIKTEDAAAGAAEPSPPTITTTAAIEDLESSVFYKMDGTIPSQPLRIQPSSSIAPTMNILDSHIQTKIRKGEYDFSQTDAALGKLGINNPAKNRDNKKGGKARNQAGGKDDNQLVNETLVADQDTATVNGGDGGDGDVNAEEEERAKRPRLDPEAEEKPIPASKESDAAFLSSLENPDATTTAAPVTTTTATVVEHVSSFYTETPLHPRERKKTIDFRGKTFLAPLTTVGNLPFRRLCKSLGADITCGEMAVATNLLQGNASEWALLKKHPEEDCFGVQLCGGFGDSMARCAQMVQENLQVDFIDVNFGCPIDVVINKGAGSACLLRPNRMRDIIQSMTSILNCPLTLKMRKGYTDKQDIAHLLLPKVASWGAEAVTLHGRTREQRYSRLADWDYIKTCADVVNNLKGENNGNGENGAVAVAAAAEATAVVAPFASSPEQQQQDDEQKMQLIGNGDVMSWEDHERAINEAGVATTYVARGALLKPWVFTEIKEKRHWDISATERLDLIKKFALNGIEHWGSDTRGIETTRRFLLEWLSFAYRYVPVGLLEVLPQKTNLRPPAFVGRSDLETLLSSPDPRDWIYISEMVLGPAPAGFEFTPKHKGTSYASAAGGGGNGHRGGGKHKNDKEEEF